MPISSSHKLQAAILGASGYTGVELIRLLWQHPFVEIATLVAEQSAGQLPEQLFTHLRTFPLPKIIRREEINWENIDIAFCALPHAMSHEVIRAIPAHIKVIDLSADFRLRDLATYETWYGNHPAPELLPKAVYGLSEWYRDEIRQASLIACPGCYPTAASLALMPLLTSPLIETNSIIIDAKSGISGAGRSAKQSNLFCEVNENVKPYNICNHRHIPEIEQNLSLVAAHPIQVNFTPQVVPLSRGILETIYIRLLPSVSVKHLHETLTKRYQKEIFVNVLPLGETPVLRDVVGTNMCQLGIIEGRIPQSAVIVSVIDNLIKGASGQAIQNMNILYGFEETSGLTQLSLYP